MDTDKHDPDKSTGPKQDVSISTASHPDSIIRAIHAFIQEERRHSFQFLAKYSHRYMEQQDLVSVSSADAGDINAIRKRVGLLRTTSFDGHWYTFTELRDARNMRRTVAVEILPDHPATIDNMTVFHFSLRETSYCVTPATTWLRDAYDWDTTYEVAKYPEKQYDEQRQWWDNNGMKFRLLALPAEIREMIYLHGMNPVVAPDIITNKEAKLILGLGISYGSGSRPGYSRDPDIERPIMTMLGVSKQVQREATVVAYRDTTKRFSVLGTIWYQNTNKILRPRISFLQIWPVVHSLSPHEAFLRHVQLEMSARGYFLFIGIYPVPRRPLPECRRGRKCSSTLESFTALQTLDFRFISPKHPGALCPWAVAMGIHNNTTHSCQKVWIDWFFVFAFHTLKAINDKRKTDPDAKRVTYSLSGCVKNSTKAHWQRVLNDERTDHTSAIGEMEKQIRLTKTEDGPILCNCSTPCAKTDSEPLFQCSEHEIRRIVGLQEELDKVYWDFED